ncbi:MAG: hypothetical protein M3N37_01230 [Actinomycetota bacterium]|nr:hypothetical protein [Actinomycetota bacterium]
MTAIAITEMEPHHFGVQVEEGNITTSCRVRLTDGFVDDLQLGDMDGARIVHESIAFLLERVPATSLAPELSLDTITREHPEYYDELRARLSSG